MKFLELSEETYRRSFGASEFLRQHRTTVIAGAFVFWSAMLAASGFFDDLDETNTWFMALGFFWMTIPMSFATYFVPRLILRVVPLMNGYRPEAE